MHWDILCPHSGLVLESFGKLHSLRSHFVCGLCDIDGETELDEFIEVSFAVSPLVRRLSLHDADSLSVEDLHWKLKFSSTGRLPGEETKFVDFLRGLVRGTTYLPPGTTTTVQAELGPGAISGVNVQTQAGFMLPVQGSPASTPARVRINYDGQRFTPAIATITPGAGVGVRAISVRGNAAYKANLPEIVPFGAGGRGGGPRGEASDLSVHGPQRLHGAV